MILQIYGEKIMINTSEYQNPILTGKQVIGIIESYKQQYSILENVVAYKAADDGDVDYTDYISLHTRVSDQHDLFGYYQYYHIASIDRRFVSKSLPFKLDLRISESDNFSIYSPDKSGDSIYLKSLDNPYDNLDTLEILNPKLPISFCPEDLKSKLVEDSLVILRPIVGSLKQTQKIRNFKEGWIFHKLKDLENLEIRKLWSKHGYYARPQQFFGLLGILGNYKYDPALSSIKIANNSMQSSANALNKPKQLNFF